MESQETYDKNKYILFPRFLSKLVTTMLSFLSWERFTDYSLVKSREGIRSQFVAHGLMQGFKTQS